MIALIPTSKTARERTPGQVEWLREQGVDDPHKFLNINELYVMLVSSCHDEGLMAGSVALWRHGRADATGPSPMPPLYAFCIN